MPDQMMKPDERIDSTQKAIPEDRLDKFTQDVTDIRIIGTLADLVANMHDPQLEAETKAIPVYGDRILVPMRAESEDGMTVGSGLVEIGPGDEGYDRALAWIQDFGPYGPR